MQARITNDDPNNRQLQLADGTVEVGLVRERPATLQVDTPSVSVRAASAGDYRISIGHDGSSWVTARRGSAEIVTPQRTYTLESGKTLVARGSASDPSITYTSEVGYDSFDDFNAKRDQTMVAALNASPNVNPDIAGYDNLGAYGQWQDVAGYGQSWVPQQSSDWSPYGNGNWTWEDGYGWTWVGARAVGLGALPLRQLVLCQRLRLGLAPPAYSAFPAWSPALVGFFGFGASRWTGLGRLGRLRLSEHRLVSARTLRAVLSRGIRAGPGPASAGAGAADGCCGGFGGTRRRTTSRTSHNIYRIVPAWRRPRDAGRELPARNGLRSYVHGRSGIDQRPRRNDSRTRCR